MRFSIPGFAIPGLSISVALLALAVGNPAQAQKSEKNRIEVDTNLICDTQNQVEKFVSLFNGDEISAEAAIAAVNEQYGTPEACVIATTAYRRAGQVATVSNANATFDVTRIVVVGVYTLKGFERSMPSEFFTLYPSEDSSTVGRR